MRSLIVLATILLSLGLAQAQEPRLVTVMTYNVENFFDAEDDPRFANGENVEVINPEAWVLAKASALARVVTRFDGGRGPDVLVLTEVESRPALDALKAALPNGGADFMTAVILDSDPTRPAPRPDQRGIDVAMLSRLPQTSGQGATAHVVDLGNETQCRDRDGSPGSTRDILEVTLDLPDGRPLSVFGVHFPSGGNPRVCREVAARRLDALAKALPADRVVVAAGDFNFNCADAEQAALRRALASWTLPPQIDNGCRGQGSQWFGREKTWSFLDVIAQRPQGGGTEMDWRIDPRTFRVVLTDFEQMIFDSRDQVMRPKAFRFNVANGRGSGVSDHWPVAIDLVRR